MATLDTSSSEAIATTLEGRQFALVVGANNSAKSAYSKPLLYAERDAYAMADVLRKPECDFTVLEPPLIGKEANTTAIREALADLVSKSAHQDFLLFYFSGHAKRMKTGENKEDVYFITYEFEEVKVKVMPHLYFSMRELWKILYEQAEANKVLLILDCCYAGKMVKAGNDPYQIDIREIVDQYFNGANIEKHRDRLRLILMATRDDAAAMEKNGHGVMTNLLLKALRGEVREVLDDEGRVDITFLNEYLTREMRVQPPILWVEGNSQPCILAHHRKLSVRFLRETDRAREDILASKLSEITSPDFFEKRAQMTDSHHTQPFDHLTPQEASLADLDLVTIADFFKRDLVQRQQDFRLGIPDQDQLVNFDFLHKSHPTYGALLCFGQNPQKWLSGSLTRCIQWRGNTRDSGWWDDQEIRGNLLKQFELCRGFLQKCLRFSRLISQEGRTEQYEIPFVALEEALANALIHREYTNRTDFVQVEVFDDRIEFRSPGDLPSPMTIDLLGVENKCHPRNPQIARIFYLHGYVERVGSGIQRMQHAMEKAGLPSPKLDLSAAKTLTVTLYRPQSGLRPPLADEVGTDEPVAQEKQLEDVHRESVKSPVQSASLKDDEGKVDRSRSSKRTSRGLLAFGVKCLCPSCFEEIYLGECNIVSGRNNNLLKKPRGHFARFSVERLDGPEYTLQDAHRVCTNCGYHLPYNIELVPRMTLAIVGDTFSGKSHYIAALIHQLKTEWMNNASGSASITCLTPDVESHYERDYFEPFLINKQSLPGNQAATSNKARPLIYNIVRSASSQYPTTTMNLMIYDTAGEDFHADRLTEYARFVLNATAFIFVADPFTMPAITNELPPSLQTRWQHVLNLAQKRRAVERLNHAMALVWRYRGQPDGSRLPDIPIAVMLSKSDLLEHVNLPQDLESYTFMRNPAYGDYLDLADIKQVDDEVQAVLTHYKEKNLLAATARFHQVNFFATSATGTIPDANNIFPSVEPRRCLDPFLWILHQLRIIRGN